MIKFWNSLKQVLSLLIAASRENVYFAVVTRRKGINEDGLMEYFFYTKKDAQDYSDWLRASNQTFEPIEIVRVMTTKKYECKVINN